MKRSIHGLLLIASLSLATWSFAAAPADAPAEKTDAPAANPQADKPQPQGLTPQQQKIADLIQQLAADDFARRDEASDELQKIGADALPALREAMKNEDPSIRSYAEYLVPKIEGKRQRLAPNAQWEVAVNRRAGAGGFAGGGGLVIARNARVQVNVADNNGLKTISVTEGDRQTTIQENPDKVRMVVTDATTGKIIEETVAKSVDELKKMSPQASAIYDNYVNGRIRFGAQPRILRINPNGAGGAMDLLVREQILDAQKLQEQVLRDHQDQIRNLLDRQDVIVQDQQLEALHRRLKAETEMLERRLAEVEAMHKRLLEQTQAAQKRLAELEKQQQKHDGPK